MVGRTDDDLTEAVAALLVGMLAPALVVALAGDLVALYASPVQFVLVAAGSFAIGAWLLVEWRDVDRTTFLLASVAVPWPVLLASVFGVLLLHAGEPTPRGPVVDVARSLVGDADAFFRYGAAFSLAGVAAVGGSRLCRTLVARHGRVPEARLVATGVAAAAALAVVLALAANLAAASAVGVSAVEPGVESPLQPGLTVTVEGPAVELRVTAVSPDGTSVTERLAPGYRRGTARAATFRVWHDEPLAPDVLPAQAGTYYVRVSGLSGVTVDAATFEAERVADLTIAETAVGTAAPTWDDRPAAVARERDGHDTYVGVVVANRGTFHATVTVTMAVPADGHRFREISVAPAESFGLVFGLSVADVEAIQVDHGGPRRSA